MSAFGSRLGELRALTQRDIEHAQHGGCTDYYCDCHLALPDCIAEIEHLQDVNKAMLAACKEIYAMWQHFELDTPDNSAIGRLRAAIATAEGGYR